MRRLLKWIGFTVAGLLGLVLILITAVYIVSGMRMSKTYTVAGAAIPIGADEASRRNGERLATIRGCIECHGQDLGGKIFIDDPALGTLYAPNLTRGKGGAASRYHNEDWDRSIRHGVNPNGRALLVMPSQEFNLISDKDLGDIVAYIESLKPVDRTFPASKVGPAGRALFIAGKIPLVPAEVIDHTAKRVPAPAPGPTVAYGQYLATTCTGCHQKDFSGGSVPGAPPTAPRSANLTPDFETGIGMWTEAQFMTALRTGRRPDGRVLNPQAMPWKMTQHMTDEEIRALYRYLRTVPAVKKARG